MWLLLHYSKNPNLTVRSYDLENYMEVPWQPRPLYGNKLQALSIHYDWGVTERQDGAFSSVGRATDF